MTRQISEPDWKVFRAIHPVALERFYERTLSEIDGLLIQPGVSAHERYLAVCQLIRRRDKELAQAFDDLRRSTALMQLFIIRAHGLLTEEELARFSPETRALLASLSGEYD